MPDTKPAEPPDAKPAETPDAKHARQVAALIAAGRQAYPQLRLDEATVRELLRAAPLPETPHPDLYLACGCLNGDRAALSYLEAQDVPAVAGQLARRGFNAVVVDEALQQLRVRLLLDAPGRPAGLRRYQGRAALRGFLLTTALRLAFDLQAERPDSPGREPSPIDAIMAASLSSVALRWTLRAHYVHEIEVALTAALAELPAEDRMMLRLYHIDKVGGERLAQLFKTNRMVILRRVEGIRAAIAAAVIARLRTSLPLPDEALRELLKSLWSEVDLRRSQLGDAAASPGAGRSDTTSSGS